MADSAPPAPLEAPVGPPSPPRGEAPDAAAGLASTAGLSASRAVTLVVAAAALLAYAGTLAYEFVWDDTLLIQRSYQLHHWRDLWPALTAHFWAEVQESSHYYRPLITLSFFLDVKLWGVNPLGFHLTNVLAHLGVSLAVLALARKLVGHGIAAGAAALLFALHPLHSESVAFVSGRTDIFATLFFLLALLGYARWRQTGRLLPWAASLIAFFLALAAKELAVVLPAVLALWDWAHGRGRGDVMTVPRALARYAPYGAVVAVYGALRFAVLGGMVDADAGAWAPFVVRALTGIEIIGRYAWLVLVPYPSNTYHVIVPVLPPPGLTWWLITGFLALTLVLTLVAALRSRVVAFGALWFWVTLIPFAGVNFLPLSAPILAERFLYLPSVGVCLLLGLAVRHFLGEIDLGGRSRDLRPAPALGLAALLVVYAALTLWRNEDWKDDYRLYLRMVETSPQSPLPHVNVAFTQIQRGEIPAANAHLMRAVEIVPKDPRALVGLGLTQTLLGLREEGLANALRAYAYAPRNANVLSTLGAIFLYRNEPARALTFLEDSLRIRPNQVNAVLNLALTQSKLGRPDEAEATLARALALSDMMSPGNNWAWRVAAEVYAPRDPARSRAAWEMYNASLRGVRDPSPSQLADLAYGERQVELLRGAGR
jgi:protein O-mannosyl-transferase